MLIFFFIALFSVENSYSSMNNFQYETDTMIYRVVEEMPRFMGCEEMKTIREKEACANKKFLEYIYKNVKTPESVRRGEFDTDRIVVKFLIDKNGNVQNLRIVQSLNPDFDAMFLELLREMPPWIPGKHKGKNVNVELMLPCRFHFQF